MALALGNESIPLLNQCINEIKQNINRVSFLKLRRCRVVENGVSDKEEFFNFSILAIVCISTSGSKVNVIMFYRDLWYIGRLRAYWCLWQQNLYFRQ